MTDLVKPALGEFLFSSADEAVELMDRAYEQSGGPSEAFLDVLEESKRMDSIVLSALDAA